MKNLLVLFLLLSSGLFAQNAVPGACGKKGNPVSPMNGSAKLGMTYNNSACGLNWVHADKLIETRFNTYTTAGNIGSGLPTTLTISGLPQCHTIDKAYVYYWVSYISSPQSSSVVITNPASATSTIAAVNIGQDQSKCWGEVGTVNYRADVTAAIAGNGNYGINVTGITGTSGNFANWYDQIDGISLIIIYKDNSATYQGSMVLWDGDMTGVGNQYTQTMTGINACAAGTNAVAFNLISDMQDNVNSNAHPSTLNGATANYPNKFWCWDQANTTVTNGQANATFGTDGLGSDCFDWGLMGLYYQTTSCVTCTPSAVSLTVTPTPSTCNAPNGSAVATATTSNPPLTYSWSTGASTTSISNLSAGVYTCTVTSATGCSSVQTCTITTSVGPAVTFTATPTKCFGSSNGSATLNASGGTAPYTYAWVTNPVQTSPTATGLAAGTYSVQVGDASGCSATYTVAVTQPTALTTSASVVNDASCFGSSDGSAIGNASGGTGPYSYTWNPSGQNTQTASGLAAGNYNVIATDANGCTKSAPVTISQPTAIALTSTATTASCGMSNGTATISASGGTGPYSYVWLTSPVQNGSTLVNVPSGTYNVLVTDSKGCNMSLSVAVPGFGPPTADFSNNPDTVNLLSATVNFYDLSTNAGTWQWDFGDPNNPAGSTQENPFHTYSDTGIYCITLIVTDPGGVCKDTATHCIKVEAPFTFYIPNAFTPNADGFNEMFFGEGTYISDFRMWIFDRWGNQIWHCHTNGEPQKDANCLWDGKVKRNGKLVEEDVYVWKVELTDANGKEHKYIGHVSMVR